MMLVRRLAVFISLGFLTSVCSPGQKLDAAFVGGVSFIPDSRVTFAVPCVVPPSSCPPPAFIDHLQTQHHWFLTGSLAVRVLKAKAFDLHLEFPAAGLLSQNLKLSASPAFANQMNSIFVTPSIRVKLAPDAIISPWASAGGGWARYTVDPDITTNKGALQVGGGFDFKVGLKRLRLRAEARDFITGDPTFALVNGPFIGKTEGGLHRHNILLGGGIFLPF
jgi:hypothetical protein